MSNYLKKFTENTAFGTTELYRYCGLKEVIIAFIGGTRKRLSTRIEKFSPDPFIC